MKIGVVGATGIVGTKLIELLENSILPIEELRCMASSRSVGKLILFRNKIISVIELKDEAFTDLDLVFFMASGDVSKKYVDHALKTGCVVIDNSSAYRMTDGIPLVVPEVNFTKITTNTKLITNPNCSTIQLVVPLYFISKYYNIKRVDVATYQAVSGAGKEAIDEYNYQIKNYFKKREKPKFLPVGSLEKHYEIVNNVIPQIDQFTENGYSKEELKVINESQKILDLNFDISCTAARVPVLNAHSESVTVQLSENVDLNIITKAFKECNNLVIIDEPASQLYPMAKFISNKKEIYVGRIRKDIYNNNIFHFWVVADNLLKGASYNALQIAENIYTAKIFGW